MIINKPQAFLIHLSISTVIFLVLSWFLVFRWFPGELFFVDGGWQGMRIIAAIDLVLGPMLTLIFYKRGKPKMGFDMSVIALVQVGALTYGVWTAHQQSTVALAFVEGRFVTVSKAALDAGDAKMLAAEKSIQPLDKFNAHRPAQIYIEPPTKDNYGAYLASVLNGMPELQERSGEYRALQGNLDKIEKYRLTLDSIGEQDAAMQQQLIEYLQNESIETESIDIYKFKARYGRGFALIDSEQEEIFALLSVDQ